MSTCRRAIARFSLPSRPWLVVAFACAYFASNELSFLLELREAHLAALWPGSGLAVAALVVASRRDRPWVLGTLAVGNVIANAIHGRAWWLSVAFAVSNAAEAAVCAGLFLRSARGRAGLARWGRFLVTTAAGALVGALVGSLAVLVAFGGSWFAASHTWFIADGVGILIVAPLFLDFGGSPGGAGRWPRLEVLVLAGLLTASTALAFGAHHRGLAFLTIPPLVFAALRTSPRVTAWCMGALALAATALTVRDRGAFSFLSDVEAVQTLQLFLVVVGAATVSLAVAVAESRAAHVEVTAREELFRRHFDDSLLGMLLLDVDAASDEVAVARANPAAAAMLGVGANDALPPELHTAVVGWVASLLAAGEQAWTGELELAGDSDRDGAAATRRWMDASLSVLDRERDGAVRLSLQLADITGRRLAERQLTDMALHDDLTGLANRTLLLEHLQRAIDAAEPDGASVAALFVDLDEFKVINDGFGHHVGDEVLRTVAARLQAAVRPGDLVSRIGGDEFVVVCPSADIAAAERIGERLLLQLREPIEVADRRYSLHASIGVTVGQPGDDAITLLRQADTAMYAVKRDGKGHVGSFVEEMHQQAERRAGLVPRLQVALDAGELRLHFQPIVNLATDRPVAVEGLIRWEHPERGLLPPSEWLDVVERSDLVAAMGRWVLAEACRWGARWQLELGREAPAVHVNVSARHLNHPSFGADVRRALDRSGFSPRRLVLEVTETHLLTVSTELRLDLERLRLLGIQISADDFGTGFSALSQVIELEVDSLKVDRSFVMAMDTSPRARAVVQAVVGLGKALDIEVVAEGVETRAHADELRAMGCPSGQGYLWSKARPPEEIAAWFTDVRQPSALMSPR